MSALASFITKRDIHCFYALNRKIHCRVLSIIMRNVTHLGSFTFSIAASLVLLIYCNTLGQKLTINLLVSQAVIHLLKRVVNRPRPYKTLDWVVPIKPPKCKYSLPSGHSSSALTIALVLSSFFPAMTAVFIPLAVIVGISRIYLGCHYPTDVTVGFMISYLVFKMLEISALA